MGNIGIMWVVAILPVIIPNGSWGTQPTVRETIEAVDETGTVIWVGIYPIVMSTAHSNNSTDGLGWSCSGYKQWGYKYPIFKKIKRFTMNE